MFKELVESIKANEGFRGEPYKDSMGYLTIGYGCKLPLSQEEAHYILVMRLNQTMYELQTKKPFITILPDNIQEVLYEMAYQLGVNGCLEFKQMWVAVQKLDYETMVKEMKNSKWYKETPERVEKLIKKVKENERL